MANPQLTSYIKQQLQLGETEAPIKNNLKSVGWSDADVNDAFKEASPSAAASPAASSPVSAVSPVLPVQKPAVSPSFSAAPQEQKKVNLNAFNSSPSANPARPGIASASPAAISFTAQKPVEAMFGSPASPSSSPSSPMAQNPAISNFAPITQTAAKKSGGIIPLVIMGVVIVGLGLFAGYLYKNNADLQTQIDNLTSQLSALTGQTTQPQNTNQDQAALTALQDQNNDLNSQLSLFLPLKTTTSSVPGATSSSVPTVVTTVAPVTLKGILTYNGATSTPKNTYILTTSKGIVVSIKNSKDVKADATLKPLIGSQVQLTGTQTAGLREITVTLVNGAPLTVPAAPAAPIIPPASTTQPGATSTPPPVQ